MRKMDKATVENVEKIVIYGFLYIVFFSYVCLGIERRWFCELVKDAEVLRIESNPDKSLSRYLDLGEHVIVLSDGDKISVHPSLVDAGITVEKNISYHRGKYTSLIYDVRFIKDQQSLVWRFFDVTVIVCLVIVFTIFIPVWKEGAIAKILVFLVLMRLAARILNGI